MIIQFYHRPNITVVRPQRGLQQSATLGHKKKTNGIFHVTSFSLFSLLIFKILPVHQLSDIWILGEKKELIFD